MTAQPRPPRWAESWLRRVTRGTAAGPSVAGDLWEEWERVRADRGAGAASRWYVAQVVALSLRYGFAALASGPAAVKGDVALAIRTLKRSPGFAIVGVLSLGGGLGLTTAVFAVVNGILFAPLPWPGGERLVDLDLVHPREVCSGCSAGASYPAFEAWRSVDGLEAVGAMDGLSVLVTGAEGAERVTATAVSPEVPGLLGVQPALGRLFTEDEQRVGGPDVVVLSHGLWERRYGGDASVLGVTVTIDGRPHAVVGVMSREARLLDRGELWLPLAPRREGTSLGELGLWVFGRTAPGTDEGALGRTLTGLHAGLAESDPLVDDEWSARVVPMRAALVREIGEPAIGWLFLAAAASVLLIACLNLAALILARVTRRTRELQVRASLGAGAGRIVRLVLIETGMVAFAGAALAMVVTFFARSAIVGSFAAAIVPPWAEFPIDVRVWLVGFGGAALAVLFCGLAPALRAARGGARGILPGANATDEPAVLARHRLLLSLQVAVGVALVASTAVSVRSFQRISDFDDLGYQTEGIIGIHVAPHGPRYETVEARATFVDAAIRAFASHPGAASVTAEAQLFIGSWGAADGPSPMHIEGRPDPVPDMIVPRHAMAISPGYFELFEIPVVRGRAIDARDGPGSERVAVVNREAVRVLWPDEEPLGARFTVNNGTVDGPITVVGIAGDIVMNPLSESRRPQPRIYFALAQANPTDVVFRSTFNGEPPSPREWSQRLATVDPEMPVDGVSTIRQELGWWIRPVVVTAGMMGTLGALALVLLAIGVFGTLSYQVAARVREIGIRRVLGAGAKTLVRDTARDVFGVLLAGIALGAVLAVSSGTVLRASFIQIGTSDPLLLGGAGAVVLVAAALAACRPLRRALAVDPLETLRAD